MRFMPNKAFTRTSLKPFWYKAETVDGSKSTLKRFVPEFAGETFSHAVLSAV